MLLTAEHFDMAFHPHVAFSCLCLLATVAEGWIVRCITKMGHDPRTAWWFSEADEMVHLLNDSGPL